MAETGEAATVVGQTSLTEAQDKAVTETMEDAATTTSPISTSLGTASKHNQKWLLKAKAILEDPSDDSDEDDDGEFAEQRTTQQQQQEDDSEEHWSGKVRKAGVAVAGGGLVGIGAVLVPMPVPLGVLTMAAGMGVLGTEFPAAQDALDTTRDKLAEFAAGGGDSTDTAAGTTEEASFTQTHNNKIETVEAEEGTVDKDKDKDNNDTTLSCSSSEDDNVCHQEAKQKQQEPLPDSPLHQKAARSLRRQASNLKENIFQPLAGKTVEVYDQIKQKTSSNNS